MLMPRQAARIPVWPGSTEVLSFRSARDAARCRVEATTEERPDLLWWALAAAAAFLLAGPLVAHQVSTGMERVTWDAQSGCGRQKGL